MTQGSEVWRSYGAQLEIFGFFDQKEVLNFQQINRSSYRKDIARCQHTWQLANKYFVFTIPFRKKFYHMVLLYDKVRVKHSSSKTSALNFSAPNLCL